MIPIRFRGLCAGVLLLLSAMPVFAADLQVTWINAAGMTVASRSLSLAEVEALPQREITTGTPWTQGKSTYRGPELQTLAGLEKAKLRSVQVEALNDYQASIELKDVENYHPVLASRLDGRAMRVRDKGPFWIIYPVDDNPGLANQLTYSRMVWQVKSLVFQVD